jgi:hypothetical protein
MSNSPAAVEGSPGAASEAELLRLLVKYAVLAPSGHNTQPWLFSIGEQDLKLLADRTRSLPVVDPHGRELTISCGAALEHLVIAAHNFSREVAVEEFPGSSRDHLATVRLAGTVSPDALDVAMFKAIPHRRTTRTKYEERMLPEHLRNACCELAAKRGTELTFIMDKERRAEIADLVEQGDRMQFADPRFRRELAAWVRSRRAATRDGMSGRSFGMPDVLSPVGALVIRTVDMGKKVAAGDRDKILTGSPVLVVLSTREDGPADWLAAGRALARVLLQITVSGATGAYLNQPVEIEQLRIRVRDAIGTRFMPQLLMRFGYGPAVPATVRRPVQDVMV